jgi:hypothetical protein
MVPDTMRATNWEMVQRVTRPTCSSGVPNSGEHDCTIPVGLVLGSSSSKLHGLAGKLSEGLDRAEVGGKGIGHGGCPRAAWGNAGRSPELRASSGELGVVQRRQRGRWSCTRVGFIAAARVWARVDKGAWGFACGRALDAPPSVSPRRTRGGLLLLGFNDQFGRLSVQILAKPPCTISSVH